MDKPTYLAERDLLVSRLAVLQSKPKHKHWKSLTKVISEIGPIWKHGSPEQRNELLSQLIKTIIIKDGAVVAIEPQPDAAPLLPQYVPAVDTGGDDGYPISHYPLHRYAESRDNLPPAFLYTIAGEATRTSIKATARRFKVSRQTVRRAILM